MVCEHSCVPCIRIPRPRNTIQGINVALLSCLSSCWNSTRSRIVSCAVGLLPDDIYKRDCRPQRRSHGGCKCYLPAWTTARNRYSTIHAPAGSPEKSYTSILVLYQELGEPKSFLSNKINENLKISSFFFSDVRSGKVAQGRCRMEYRKMG